MEASGIIMSIRPEHAFDIMSGRKTVELRRRFPERVQMGSLISSMRRARSSAWSGRRASRMSGA